ncbi:MAG TPA: hypothetical protein VNA19_17475 [Pyrinomonadaceae bacterium]|jgi:hypothetical protein|nr:hypothetical protein [Pyrinomonadaceae bacterium]
MKPYATNIAQMNGATAARPQDSALTPYWAYAFMVACILIPVVSLGGAISGGIGAGGAATCRAIANNPAISKTSRIMLCLAATFLCWTLFLFVMFVIFRTWGG